MRELRTSELDFVSGGLVCREETAANTYGGISRPSSVGGDLISFYEGLIQATSYMIERVANSF